MRKIFLLPLALLAWAAPSFATSVLLVPDDQAVDRTRLAVVGTVVAQADAQKDGRPYTDYRVEVERSLKGNLAAGDVVPVRVLGGSSPDGLTLTIYGAPHFTVGERVLLLLGRHADGTLRPFQVVLGHFQEATVDGKHLWVRDLSEVDVVDGKAEAVAPGMSLGRDFDRFPRWIADRAAGKARAADYRSEISTAALKAAHGKYTYLGGGAKRWIEFDNRVTINWLAESTGQPNLDSGGFPEFQAAINAWNNDPATNIRYGYSGTISTHSGFARDFTNLISFQDWADDIDEGDFACIAPGNGSGVLAIGGPWTFTNEAPPKHILEADIVVNNGAGCWFDNNGARASQVYAHELGHTLGLGHSCGDDDAGPCDTGLKDEALMRANAHRDNRGPALNDDDRAGILSLYAGGTTPATKPAAPTALVATVASATQVNLAWQDNANDETTFRIERKTAVTEFAEISSVNANVTSASVTGLAPGTTYTFRVRARNSAGNSAYSNEVTVTTTSTTANLPAAPSLLVATPLSTTQIRLAWHDNSTNETGFQIERSSPAGGFVPVTTAAAGATTFTVTSLATDFPYTFRVRAINASGASAYSNLASASTRGTAGACSSSATELCLNGGRFRVNVRWRTGSGDTGTGKAVVLAGGQTGMFWFFDSANIELIVKVLDGTSLNNFYWTFYGGLSDVSYWITVTDTQTGQSKTYANPQGNFCGAADTASLPAAGSSTASFLLPAEEPAAETLADKAGCAAGANTLCLLGGRFKVEVTWQQQNGPSGNGGAVPIAGNDQSGLFWFFDPSNIELVVKVIDGTGLNGKYWFFYGALSDVGYTVRVTDTTTGAVRNYTNAFGNVCGRADTSAF
jgi:hypothetical protein